MTPNLTPKEECAIRQRLADATPGPWYVDESLRGVEARSSEVGGIEIVSWTSRHCAVLIAHAPTDIARLLDEVERLRAIVEPARILLGHLDYIGMTREEDPLMDDLRAALDAATGAPNAE